MAKLIEQYGTRTDGVKINFTDEEMPLDKHDFYQFVSITRTEVMTQEEFAREYPHLKTHTV